MKKLVITLLALALLPPISALAQDGGRHHGRGDDGGSGNSGTGPDRGNRSGNDNSSNDKQPQKISEPQGKRSPRNNPGGWNQGTIGHHFDQKGQMGRPSGSSAMPPGQTPHHFIQNGERNWGGHPSTTAPNDSAHFARNENHTAAIPPRLKQMGVTHLPPTLGKNKILSTGPQHSTITRPQTGPRGQSLHAALIEPKSNNAVVIRNHMSTINNNSTVMAQINVYNNRETVTNHYYWHTWNGTSYCHYYDSWGYHWYGWYWGDTCFWSRWYGGYWWWYDPGYARWCYWHDGWWWWQDPYQVNVVYVYNEGQYTSTQSTQVSTDIDYRSKDGTRTVKIEGDDAFLYDTSDPSANPKPFYLASGVKEVKFSKTDNGQPLQIMLILNDGSFETFDSDGNSIGNNSDGTEN